MIELHREVICFDGRAKIRRAVEFSRVPVRGDSIGDWGGDGMEVLDVVLWDSELTQNGREIADVTVEKDNRRPALEEYLYVPDTRSLYGSRPESLNDVLTGHLENGWELSGPLNVFWTGHSWSAPDWYYETPDCCLPGL